MYTVKVELIDRIELKMVVCEKFGHIEYLNKNEVINQLLAEIKAGNKNAMIIWLYGHLDRYVQTIKHLQLRPRSGTKVLEIGSAPGFFSKLLRLIYRYEVWCLDKKLSSLPDYISEMKAHDIHVLICDVEREPFPFDAESFDFIFLLEVIEHLVDPNTALREMHRVLKGEGQIIVSTPNLHRFGNLVRKWLSKQPKSHGVRELAPSELVKLLKSSGFTVDYIQYLRWSERKWALRCLAKSKTSMTKCLWFWLKWVVSSIRPSLSSNVLLIAKKISSVEHGTLDSNR